MYFYNKAPYDRTLYLVPKRMERRHQMQRMKARAARQWRRWAMYSPTTGLQLKSMSGTVEIRSDARDIARSIGHLAATHCRPCSCHMCDYRHKYGIEKTSYVSVRVIDLQEEFALYS